MGSERTKTEEKKNKQSKTDKKDKVVEKQVENEKSDKKGSDKKQPKSDKQTKTKTDDDKPKKPSKPNKFAGIERGDCPNIATAAAKLHLNVKTCQKWMVEYLSRYTITKKNPDDDNRVKILGAHFVLTAADEVICSKLATLGFARSKKGEAGLNTITEDNLIDSVRLDKEFNYTFGKYLDAYSTGDNYGAQLGMSKETIVKFLESFAFNGGNNNVHLDNSAYNFLMYILLKNRIQMTDAAYHVITYANKTSVNDKSMLHVTRMLFVGSLGKTICQKIEDVSLIMKQLTPENKEKDDDDEHNEKEKKEKKTSDKNDKKKTDTKKTEDKQESSEEESESESESESEDESGDDN